MRTMRKKSGKNKMRRFQQGHLTTPSNLTWTPWRSATSGSSDLDKAWTVPKGLCCTLCQREYGTRGDDPRRWC